MIKTLKTQAVAFAVTMVVALFALGPQAFADNPIYTTTFSNTALKGYDTVSYFQGNGEPVQGSEEYETQWRGATWRFSSAKNLEAFKTSPEKYAPQYGGYCAWAAAHGSLAKGDPLVYTKFKDKLYLNYDRKINEDWLPRKEELIIKADTQYPELVDIQ